jgi:hypothetical protein
MKTIHISATQARKNFFEILQRVVQENVSFVVENKNLDQKVTIRLDQDQVKAQSSQIDLDKLYGSLKSTVPYQENETEQAHQIYAKNQVEKYD